MASVTVDSASVWFGLVSSVFFVAGGVWGFARFIHRRWVSSIADQVSEIHEETKNIRQETSNNGGGSMKDAVQKTEVEIVKLQLSHDNHQKEMRESLSRIEGSLRTLSLHILEVDRKLERHLGEHEGAEI
jgi:hypothetical protein